MDPESFLVFSYAAWVDTYTRFGPHPERGRQDVEAFFADAVRRGDGRIFYQLEWLVPMAYLDVAFPDELRQTIERLHAVQYYGPRARAGFPDSDEEWSDHVTGLQEDAAR